jgi:hypothetical protein
MKVFLFSVLLFFMASSAHAQLPPGPVIGPGGVDVACIPPADNAYNTTCRFPITAPNNPNLSCVFFTNVATLQTLNALPDPFDNPMGLDCIPVAPGQQFFVTLARQTTAQSLAGSLFGNGHIRFVAAGQLNVGVTRASLDDGIIVDISISRFFRALCLTFGSPATCAGNVGNDIGPGVGDQ